MDSGMEDGMDGRGRDVHAKACEKKAKRKSMKTVLVLPPDDRMEIESTASLTHIRIGGRYSIFADEEIFPLICIGLWELVEIKKPKGRGLIWTAGDAFVIGEKSKWVKLANGEIKLEDCRFRKTNRKERKDLGL